MDMCYAHIVCTSGMQAVSACPTGRLQLQLRFGNVQLTVRGMSHTEANKTGTSCFSLSVQQRHCSVVAEDASFATLCC